MNLDIEQEFKDAARVIGRILTSDEITLAKNSIESLSNPNVRLSRNRIVGLEAVFVMNDVQTIAATLSEWHAKAPHTFEARWKRVDNLLQNYSALNNTLKVIDELADLIGWAQIEAFWNNQSINTDGVELAGIALGFDVALGKEEILRVLRTHSSLLKGEIFKKFDESIKGGLVSILDAEKDINGKIEQWEKRLDEAEKVHYETVAKLDSYQKSLEKYQVAFGFLGLTGAFKNFFIRKQKEHRLWALACVMLAACMLGVALSSHTIARKVDQANVFSSSTPSSLQTPDKDKTSKDTAAQSSDKKDVKDNKEISKDKQGSDITQGSTDGANERWASTIWHYLPVIAVELLILYFFRIALTHYNSTKSQLLQLEIRMALCAFIDEYSEFAKEHKEVDLSKFEAMIFSSIVSNDEKIPSTFDGLEQIGELVRSVRGGK